MRPPHSLSLLCLTALVCGILLTPSVATAQPAPAPAPPAAPQATPPAAETPSPEAGGGWLDAKPLPRWNLQGSAVPKPPAIDGEPLATGRCAGQARPPETPGDRALTEAGWVLVGPLQLFGEVSVATGASAADGMCRPLGLQAFVFVRGRFAGTLSPHAMASRTDGVISDIRLVSRDRIFVTYARYAPEDALCCPSRTSTATFGITRSPGGSVLAVESVTTQPNAPQ